MATTQWTVDQTKLAFHLYCQLPFGRIHERNPEIVKLAKAIGRTPGAVAMKMLNIASLDPAIRNSGRVGLGNASARDREVWDEFHSEWERLAVECQSLREQLDPKSRDVIVDDDESIPLVDFSGETRHALINLRVKQNFFRRAVLSSYRGRCCMSGLSDLRLLIASHIVPWSEDKANRLNPSNGLCLSAIHDRAFDKGLISLTDDGKVLLSAAILKSDDPFLKSVFLPLENRLIEMPDKFRPHPDFLKYHQASIFLDSAISLNGS